MNEIVEKKILVVETPINRVLFSLKLPTPMFAYLDFIAENGEKHEMEGIFLKLENIV